MSVVQLSCRCFMSARSPASSPSKSRVVEAVCIRLCDAITQPLADSRPNGSTLRLKVAPDSRGIKPRAGEAVQQPGAAGGNGPCAVRDQRSPPASLVQAARTAQGGSAVAAGKAGARRAAVLRAAAASLAEPPFSGRSPPRTPPGLSACLRHQWPGNREAPSYLHGDDRRADRRRSGIAPSPAAGRRRPVRARAPTRNRAPVPDDGLAQRERAPPAPIPRVRKTRCCQKCHQPTGSVGHSQYKG